MRLSGIAMVVALAACGASGRGISPIRLNPVVTLGGTSGAGAISASAVVSARHPAGFRIVVQASNGIGAQPLAFSDDGSFLGALQGDRTQAGSFTGAMFTRIGPGDSVWVFDNDGRALLFDSERRYVRTVTLPAVAWDAIMLGDGRLLTSDSPEPVAQLLDASGVLVRSIVLRDSTEPRRPQPEILVPANDGTFWTTSATGPWRLTQWDTAGTRRSDIMLSAPWLPATAPQSPDDAGRRDQPPDPLVAGAWIDTAGRLWIVGRVADRKWKAGIDAVDPAKPDQFTIADGDKYYDTIVEVRDLKTGSVIATTRFDQYLVTTGDPGVIMHQTTTSAGWVRAELMRVVLDAPTSR